MTNKERLQKNNLNLTECLSLAANLPKAENGKPIEIEALDNTLLVVENEGKIYKCNGKLYNVIFDEGKGPLVDLLGAELKLTKNFEIPAGYGKFNLDIVYENGRQINGAFCVGYNLDESTGNLIEAENSICHEDFIIPDDFMFVIVGGTDTKNPKLMQWFLYNNPYVVTDEGTHLDYTFKELDTNITELSDDLLTYENVGKVYNYGGRLYTVGISVTTTRLVIHSQGNLKPLENFSPIVSRDFELYVMVPYEDYDEDLYDELGYAKGNYVPAPSTPGSYVLTITITDEALVLVYDNGQVFSVSFWEPFSLCLIIPDETYSYQTCRFFKWLAYNQLITKGELAYSFKELNICS